MIDKLPPAFIFRVMPPIPVYDHKSMRDTGRPKPHALNPDKATHTFCGKPTEFWRLLVDPLETFDLAAFREHGCLNCSRALARYLEERTRDGQRDTP